MRKIYLLLSILFCECISSHAAQLTSGSLNPFEWPAVKLSSCIKLSAGEIERLTGKRLTVFQKIAYRLLRGKMKRAVQRDPNITLDQFMHAKKRTGDVSTGLLIFALVGLVLVLILIVFYRSFDP